MSMKRNDSDFQINGAVQRSVPPKKSMKYNSIDRGGGTGINENEVSPMVMKKKANVHLEPMSHKKATLMQSGIGVGLKGATDLSMGHSESNPLLA